MVLKSAIVKGAACLTVTSAVGIGAVKVFVSKNPSQLIQEEIKKRFIGWTNRSVLARAGFKDVSNNRELQKTSLSGRFADFVASKPAMEKLSVFCKKKLDESFEGITDEYKRLAVVCTEKLTILDKVKWNKLTILDEDGLNKKLSSFSEKQLQRKMFKELETKDAASLFKACSSFESKDVFSFQVTKENLADYMTFCIAEPPSVIRFWTGVEKQVEEVKNNENGSSEFEKIQSQQG